MCLRAFLTAATPVPALRSIHPIARLRPVYEDGETTALVDRMKTFMRDDTTRDDDFKVNAVYTWKDAFVITTALICAVPKALVLWPFMSVCALIPAVVQRAYLVRMPPTVMRLEAGTSMVIICLPLFTLTIISLAIDYALMYFMGMLFVLFNNGKARYDRNIDTLAPYDNGPVLIAHLTDIIVAMAGQVHRQGVWEAASRIVNMVLVLPWLKHWVIANRYVFELEERYITQIGQSLGTYTHDMGVQFKHNISQAKVLQKARDEVDATFFSAHYPHPPPGRNYAIGMQMAHMFATLVHTTHAYEDLPVVAKDMVVPIYRVMLWGNNPFHLFTGYVEAGISNGEPSQSHKRHGICHPMVLVCSKDKVSGGYVNYIDAYFDRYIPFLSAFVCAHTFNETF